MKIKKIKKFIFLSLIIVISVFTFIISPIVQQSITPIAKADTQSDLDAIKKKLADLQAQKDALNSQIKKEQSNQQTFAQQAKDSDRRIQQNQIQIESLELELEQIKLEVKLLKQQQIDLQKRLTELESKLVDTNDKLDVSLNLLYKLSLSSPTIFAQNASFQDFIINQEQEKSVMEVIKSSVNDVNTLKKQVEEKKVEIDQKEKDASALQAQKEAQTNNLQLQVSALKWQKDNKLSLLSQSQQAQQTLNDQQKITNQKIAEMQSAIAAIMNSLLIMPAGGAFVTSHQVIGLEGRSGLSCGFYDPKLVPVKTNSYCTDVYPKGAGLNSDWYYYDPIAFPSRGAHLHFVYFVGGKINCVAAQNALFDPNNTDFKSDPLDSFYQTQGCHDGGAVDLASRAGFGAPVYSVKAGYVNYRCVRFPNDPAFPDPLFGAIVTHVDANGKLDGTVSAYWHLKRNRSCDGIWAN